MTLPPFYSHDNMRMSTPGYTTQFLERLSTHELITLAEEHGFDIPHDLERVFIIDELLCLDRQGIGASAETEEQLQLLRQHNVSIIEVLVRDPLWAFVFWEVKEHDKDLYEDDEDFNGYCLRVVPFKENSDQPDMAGSFLVALDKNDSARYLGFPPDDRRLYKIELCVPRLDTYTVLAVSRSFKMPQLIDVKQDGELYQNFLATLSGINDIPFIRSISRQLRPRGE